MKKLLKTFTLVLISLKVAAIIIPSISFNSNLKILLLATLSLTAFEHLLKPIAKILFLPINILTLGTLRWVINVIGLYLVTLFVKGFSISNYHFLGLNWKGIIIPSIDFSPLLTYIIASFIINLIISCLRWLFGK